MNHFESDWCISIENQVKEIYKDFDCIERVNVDYEPIFELMNEDDLTDENNYREMFVIKFYVDRDKYLGDKLVLGSIGEYITQVKCYYGLAFQVIYLDDEWLQNI